MTEASTATSMVSMVGARPRAGSGAQIELLFEDQELRWSRSAVRCAPTRSVIGPSLTDTILPNTVGRPWPDGDPVAEPPFEVAPIAIGTRTSNSRSANPKSTMRFMALCDGYSWSIAEQARDRLVVTHTLHPQDGGPLLLDLRIEHKLGQRGLSIRTTATNAGAEPAPYGAGAHPYLTLGTATIDELVLQAPGTRWTPLDDFGIPAGSQPVTGTEYDVLVARRIGSTQLDTGYTELERDEAGLTHVTLNNVDPGTFIRLWMDHPYRFLMLFTGDSLLTADRRRRGLGIGPMTCAPNALQSEEGLRTLKPGESCTSMWGTSSGAKTPATSEGSINV